MRTLRLPTRCLTNTAWNSSECSALVIEDIANASNGERDAIESMASPSASMAPSGVSKALRKARGLAHRRVRGTE